MPRRKEQRGDGPRMVGKPPGDDNAALVSADSALAQSDWHRAAERYSRAIEVSRERLKAADPLHGGSGARKEDVATLAAALRGRARALSEMGKRRGQLSANAEVLKASIADACTAASLIRQCGQQADTVTALGCLSDVLIAADRADEAQIAVQEVLSEYPSNVELQGLAKRVSQSVMQAEMDAEADDGSSPGTFRWPRNKQLPTLPPLQEGSSLELPSILSDGGWEHYLTARGGEAMVASARAGPALLDGLSFPLSLAWVLSTGRAAKWRKEFCSADLHIIVLGATAKAEVRLFLETQYWLELERLLAGRCCPRLWFVGPEVDSVSSSHNSYIHRLSPPCAKRFFEARPALTPENSVCAVFNGGFGNFVASGQDSLLWSWLPDLWFLSERGFLCAFFCANDYADLRGEVAVHRTLLGSRFVMAPRRNPFSMATVFSGEAGGDGANEWFCGNSFVYATCGCDADARLCSELDTRDETARQRMAAAVQARSRAFGESGVEVLAGQPPLLRPVALNANETRQSGNTDQHSAFSLADAPQQAREGGELASSAVAENPRQDGNAENSTMPVAAANASVTCFVGDDGCRWARLEVDLPSVARIDEVDLQISDTCVSLSGPRGYKLLEAWPEHVDAERASAAFSTRRHRIVVKAPVIA